eukprot:154214_1
MMLAFVKCRHVPINQSLASITLRYCSNQIEDWRDIPGFSKYQASSFGSFKIKKSGKLLKINYERFKKWKRTPTIILCHDFGKRIHVSPARTILSLFHPVQSNEKLYTVHINGDKYDNKLLNLEWNKNCAAYRNVTNVNLVPIQLRSNTNEILNFESLISCQAYLTSLGINRAHSTIYGYCLNKQHIFGYTFSYLDSARYQYKVVDSKEEIWKMYRHTDHGTEYWVSNKARIKSVSRNGRERVIKTRLKGGYIHVALRSFQNESAFLHRIVALCWVPNPNNYKIIDHIDT